MPRISLVVERIPRELYDVSIIREYFSRFGEIKVRLINENSLSDRRAIVRFSSIEESRAAFECSDAIMGNRFVRVHYLIPESERDKDLNGGSKYHHRNGKNTIENNIGGGSDEHDGGDFDDGVDGGDGGGSGGGDGDGAGDRERERDRDRPIDRSRGRFDKNKYKYRAPNGASAERYNGGVRPYEYTDQDGPVGSGVMYGGPPPGLPMALPLQPHGAGYFPHTHMAYPLTMAAAGYPGAAVYDADEETRAEIARKKADMLRDLRDIQAKLRVKRDDPEATEETRASLGATMARITRQIETLVEEVHGDPASDVREFAKLQEERKRELLDRELDDIASSIRKTGEDDNGETQGDNAGSEATDQVKPKSMPMHNVQHMPMRMPMSMYNVPMPMPMSMSMNMPMGMSMPMGMNMQLGMPVPVGPGQAGLGSSHVWVSERPRFSLDLRPSTLIVSGVPQSRRDEIELLMRSFGEVATATWHEGGDSGDHSDHRGADIEMDTSQDVAMDNAGAGKQGALVLEIKYVTRGYAEKAQVTATQRKAELGDNITVEWKTQ